MEIKSIEKIKDKEMNKAIGYEVYKVEAVIDGLALSFIYNLENDSIDMKCVAFIEEDEAEKAGKALEIISSNKLQIKEEIKNMS
ncbi:hypothetical protein GCM10008916_08080 [Clostridium nitritogenes]|uniref:Uncharacterized protein n=1 Tax=Clostridium nitritogenes TaxID=83340 RepID=A0ABP3WVY0_9CLOT